MDMDLEDRVCAFERKGAWWKPKYNSRQGIHNTIVLESTFEKDGGVYDGNISFRLDSNVEKVSCTLAFYPGAKLEKDGKPNPAGRLDKKKYSKNIELAKYAPEEILFHPPCWWRGRTPKEPIPPEHVYLRAKAEKYRAQLTDDQAAQKASEEAAAARRKADNETAAQDILRG